jgi:hypothetical protein
MMDSANANTNSVISMNASFSRTNARSACHQPPSNIYAPASQPHRPEYVWVRPAVAGHTPSVSRAHSVCAMPRWRMRYRSAHDDHVLRRKLVL